MRVRRRIWSLLAVLLVLWGFGAWVTVANAYNVFFVTLVQESGNATESTVAALQVERRLTASRLG